MSSHRSMKKQGESVNQSILVGLWGCADDLMKIKLKK